MGKHALSFSPAYLMQVWVVHSHARGYQADPGEDEFISPQIWALLPDLVVSESFCIRDWRRQIYIPSQIIVWA